jgi:hypothetical protein
MNFVSGLAEVSEILRELAEFRSSLDCCSTSAEGFRHLLEMSLLRFNAVWARGERRNAACIDFQSARLQSACIGYRE